MTEIELPSRTDAVAVAADFVQAEARRAGWAVADVTRAVLAVSEAVGNAVEHGPGRGVVRVRCESSDDFLRLDVSDGGAGPTQHAIDAACLPASPLTVDGRGLYIMKTVADEIQISDGVLSLRFVRAGRA